jgi:methyltransferase (TIGR00027 family)
MPSHPVTATAHWVAAVRARESARPDALFHDACAQRLAGRQGEDFLRTLPAWPPLDWAIVVRTAVIDQLLLAAVAAGTTTVINLGAGLDTRAWRLPLPPQLHWLDVDLPEVIAHRRAHLRHPPAACAHSHLSADLNDPAALDRVLASAQRSPGRTLVLTEGVLVYLSDEAVSGLAQRLLAEPTVQGWLTDLVTPAALAWAGPGWPNAETAAQAPFRFAPADAGRFFGALGWHLAQVRAVDEEALRLHRAPLALQWWRAMGGAWWGAACGHATHLASVALLARR